MDKKLENKSKSQSYLEILEQIYLKGFIGGSALVTMLATVKGSWFFSFIMMIIKVVKNVS